MESKIILKCFELQALYHTTFHNKKVSIIIRESMYKKLEDMREKYGISISKLINIAIRAGIEKYDKK